jgi:predicted negative regulator of RcsB-dependent stress response
MLSNTVMLPAMKTMGFHLFPGATLLIGGALAWNIWQQRQQVKNNKSIQDKLSKQINDLETQLSTKEDIKETAKIKTSKPKFQSNPKHSLFEQLIHDNIVLREAH